MEKNLPVWRSLMYVPVNVTVPILNEEYGYTSEEVVRAQAMVDAYDAALAAGKGAIEFEGKMIDIPVVARAQETLNRAAKIAARRK
jgi:citrate lyase subunit beta/citryl-CoA lyase